MCYLCVHAFYVEAEAVECTANVLLYCLPNKKASSGSCKCRLLLASEKKIYMFHAITTVVSVLLWLPVCSEVQTVCIWSS